MTGAGETEAEAHRPAHRESDDRNPRRARLFLQLAEDCRQHAILRHGQRQARVAHDQSVEHAKGADHAAEDDANAEQRSAKSPAISAQEPVSQAVGVRPVIHMAANGNECSSRPRCTTATSIARG